MSIPECDLTERKGMVDCSSSLPVKSPSSLYVPVGQYPLLPIGVSIGFPRPVIGAAILLNEEEGSSVANSVARSD